MSTTTTEMTQKVEQVKVASGFGKRNANKKRIEDEEAELAKLMGESEESVETDEAQEEQVDDGPEPQNAEERTFKKRYGDLRRHAQKKEGELQSQIDELRSQLEASTKQQIQYPTSESELESWMEQYPDVAKIVETIAMKKAHEQASEFESKFREIDEMRMEAVKEKAEAELMRMHPDFGEIRDDDAFHDWVDEQPSWVRDALYHNESDALSASRAVDLYKADKGISKKTKSSSDKDAAKAVGTRSERSAPEQGNNGNILRESEVDKWSAEEFERRQDELALAVQEDRFILDMSGGAR
jgi:hypothetical protein